MAELTLPQETSWKLLSVSPDMMDTKFGNKTFPFRWRSSLAISASEPDPAQVPPGCEGRLTMIKVTATITGYQPTPWETRAGFASFPNVPTEELQRIIGQYFACYGALLTVAVFPHKPGIGGGLVPGVTKIEDFPHIIDVEPKTRELIQAASESGEILTSSKSNLKTNKSLTHTDSTENGWELNPTVKVGAFEVSGVKLSHKNTETEEENWVVETDASRERQEKQGSTTQISQLYNLLSSYHVGTNRAQFLMLARPHMLEPTDHRTFVDGLRQIEGVQEFVLIVARPPDMPGICIEAQLETGHFPEGLPVEDPKPRFEESSEDFKVIATAAGGIFSGDTRNFEATHDVELGRVVDTRPERNPDAGHPGMKQIADDSTRDGSLANYNYRRVGDGRVLVSGRITGGGIIAGMARFDRTYRVFTRSIAPIGTTGSPHVPVDRLLITSRNLRVCFLSGAGGKCPVVDPVFIPPDENSPLIAEVPISIPGRALPVGGASPMPAAKALLAQVGNAMSTSWRLPQRRPADEAPGFLESDYFKDQIRKYLPRDQLGRKAADAAGLGTSEASGLSESATVEDMLELDLTQFADRMGLSLAEAIKARRAMLGILEPPPATGRAD